MDVSLKNNPSEAVEVLLKSLQAKFTDYSINSLKQHPDYPSLLSINHTLNQLQIDNLAIRATYEQLQNKFPKPLLVHTRDEGGTYRVIAQLDEEQVTFVDRKGKQRSQSKTDFLKSWSGIAVLVDEETKGEERGYALNKIKALLNKAVLPLLMFSLALLMVYIISYTDNLLSTFDYLFLLTKTLGIAATIPLIIRLLDKNNPFVKKLCHSGKAGGKSNCARVLDSPTAHLLELFAWSEIGFVYFTSLFLYVLLFPSHLLVLIAGLAVLAAPYTFYSVYYQWKVARQWCRLCLAVQGVILLELILAILYFNTYSFTALSLAGIASLLLVSAIVVSTYSLLKPILTEIKSNQTQIQRLKKIKYKPEVFQLLLSQNPAMDTSEINAIQLGNPESKHKITIISNPTCGPCVKMHHRLFELLKTKENINLQEIFLTSEDENSPAYQIAKAMLKLYQTKDIEIVKEAIASYYRYEKADYKKWLEQYASDKTGHIEIKQILKQHIAWCRERKISATPTMLYNGYELPKEYTIEDLDYLMD
ncbi:vitamin K epoxide reductase family protein [Porifericola rhodea]|uniref:vitamin K epoxide reductase family protein n=1 Tax=Porifericola rhodea TaxID=930972 RepID=UPI002666E64B|nr:vitamin K epoxide reductase family protein [Porifericola rhodea]WKN29766.1 vitamin K epoxide reductase family protein [Porifericola rhodea]